MAFAECKSILLMTALSRYIFTSIHSYVSKLPTNDTYENAPLVEHAFSSIAQSVEHAAVNRAVVGSSPTRGVKKLRCTYEFV